MENEWRKRRTARDQAAAGNEVRNDTSRLPSRPRGDGRRAAAAEMCPARGFTRHPPHAGTCPPRPASHPTRSGRHPFIHEHPERCTRGPGQGSKY